MNSPSEERVMRAREVLAETAHAEGCNFLSRAMADCDCDRPIRAMLAFSDEGSGIGGGVREALRPYLQHKVGCRNRLRMGQRYCSCGLSDILSPDIDRSGLAQEVE